MTIMRLKGGLNAINMPSQQKHRGQHPQDHLLFSEKWRLPFGQAAQDLSYLLKRGYGENSGVKIVGDRFRLNARQRKALLRLVSAPSSVEKRLALQIPVSSLKDKVIVVDGFNLIIFVESVLSNGIILACMDGVYRDIASVHGSYKRVVETGAALGLLGAVFEKLEVAEVRWLLDAPVSNSGRLKQFLEAASAQNAYNWSVDLVPDPDKTLVELREDVVAISSDSWILDRVSQWVNVNAYLIEHELPEARIFDCLSIK